MGNVIEIDTKEFENLRRVELGMELTRPLKQLNTHCEFKSKYEEWCNIKDGLPEDADIKVLEAKARKKEYRQRPEVKAKMKVYIKKYNQRSEVIAMKKEYRQRLEVKAKRKEYFNKYYKANREKILEGKKLKRKLQKKNEKLL